MSGAIEAGARRHFTALVLAASRGAADPVAKSEGTSHKCLVDVAGVPMLVRVVDALSASPSIGAIAISIEAPEVLEALTPLAHAAAEGRIALLRSGATTSASVLAAVEALGDPYPLLIATADNPLLTPEMVEHFCAQALASDAGPSWTSTWTPWPRRASFGRPFRPPSGPSCASATGGIPAAISMA